LAILIGESLPTMSAWFRCAAQLVRAAGDEFKIEAFDMGLIE